MYWGDNGMKGIYFGVVLICLGVKVVNLIFNGPVKIILHRGKGNVENTVRFIDVKSMYSISIQIS